MKIPFKKRINRTQNETEQRDNEQIITDPFGCYTGRPLDAYEKPVQDADDL